MRNRNLFLSIMHISIFMYLFIVNYSYALDKLPTDITKIALVIGAPKDAVESSFGHSFLRFSNKTEFGLSDWTVEFTADASQDLSYLRGLGIGSSYKMNVTLSNYGATSLGYTQVMDRDLIQYELNLSPEQIHIFVDAINGRIEHSKEDSYNFLFKNCTSGISEIIEEVTKSKIQGYSKNVPIWLPKKLKKLNLIKKEFSILSNTSIRGKIIDKKFDDVFDKYLKKNAQEYYLIFNLKDQLKSNVFQDRFVGYLKIVYLVKNQKIDKDDLDFAKSLINSEIPSVKFNLLSLLNLKLESTYDFFPLGFESLKEVSDDEKKLISNIETKKNLNVIVDKNQKMVELSIVTHDYEQLNQEGQVSGNYEATYVFDFPQIIINEKSMDITINNKLVDLLDKDLNLLGANTRNYLIYPDFIEIRGRKYLLPIFILDNLSSWSLLHGPGKWDSNSISLLNKSTKQSPNGNCNALMVLQKQLMENSYFEPTEEKRTPSYYENLMKQALKGDKVIVPGVRSIREWSNLVTEEKVQNIVSELNKKVGSFSYAFWKWFQRESINSTLIDKMKQYVQHGLYPIITFSPYSTIKVEHALLLYDIEERSDYYLLHVYDPNFGIIPKISPLQFRVDKKTFNLSSTVYKEAKPNSMRVNFQW